VVSGNCFALSPKTIPVQQRDIKRLQRAIEQHDVAQAEHYFAVLQRKQAKIVIATQQSTQIQADAVL
jgi:stalled ribosome rescue protein Dom34